MRTLLVSVLAGAILIVAPSGASAEECDLRPGTVMIDPTDPTSVVQAMASRWQDCTRP